MHWKSQTKCLSYSFSFPMQIKYYKLLQIKALSKVAISRTKIGLYRVVLDLSSSDEFQVLKEMIKNLQRAKQLPGHPTILQLINSPTL